MDFRRSGQLDERRRRVLMDEITAPPSEDATDATFQAGSAKGPVRAYAPAVLSDRQPRIIDFLPVRPHYVAVAIMLGLTGIAAIEALHIHAATLSLKAGSEQLAALDVSSRGSLAAWFSSLLLITATISALLVFAIRVHRVDDYRGRYRVWLWATAALAWLSLDAATGIHDALGLAITLVGKPAPSASLAAACTATWLGLYGLILGALGIRLAIEIWPSLPSIGALLLAGCLYLSAGLLQLGMLTAATPLGQSVAESTVAMLAHLALTSAVGLYARHVYLDASGRLKVHIDPDKKRSAKAKSRAKLKVVKEDKSFGTDAQPEPAAKRVPAAQPAEPVKFGAAAGAPKSGASIAASQSAYDDEDDDDEGDYGGEKLSKSERRRLKKLARQGSQRRAA
jgi:hypothetical protein